MSEAFAEQVARVRASGVLGRSQGLARLFDVLADPARDGRALSEADVAHQVFGRALDLSGDASVRVYVHRLRKKLEAFYEGPGAGETARLSIPVGEYRLVLTTLADAPAARPRRRLPGWAPIVAALLVLLNLGAWWAVSRGGPDRALARAAASPLWAGLGRDRPVVVVIGDYYIFGDTEGGEGPRRMIRAFEINSPADLDAWLMDNPTYQGRYIDLDTYYTPVGATLALREVMPLVRQAVGRSDRISVITASHLTADLMKSADIVYVGYLSGLRLLQAPVFERSRFSVGATYDELVDRRSGQTFTSSAGAAADDRPNLDYGYLAAFRGTEGNRVIVVAGARDIGVMQTAEIAARGEGPAVDREAPFEALYEVEGVGRTNLRARAITPAR